MGMMDHATKAKFVLALHKHSLQALDSGGILGIPGALTVQNGYNASGPDMAGVVANQNQLAGQLQSTAAGTGPNAAQEQFKRNSGQITQQAANTYSGNRALNPGLAARLSGNTAAQVSQNQASQSAELQAQQQVAAQQQLAQLYGQQQNASLGAQGINSQISQNNSNAVNQTQQGILSSLPIIGGLFAEGGMVQGHKMAAGGSINSPYAPNFSNADLTSGKSKGIGPQSGAMKWLTSPLSNQPTAATEANNYGAGSFFSGEAPELGSEFASAAPAAALALDQGGMAQKKLMKAGGPVKAPSPGQKAKVKDDSLKNDVIPAALSEGEIVIPRHITMHPQAPEKAAAFVRAALNKRRMGKSS